MSQLTDNLSAIASIKSDIAAAIESKGVSMSGVSFGSYADKIGEITTSFVTEPLNVTDNGVYNPGQGVDGFSQVTVNVPQSVTGFTEKDLTEGQVIIVNLSNSASFVASSAFANNNTLRTVYLPNCSSVKDYAFQNCHNLQTVDLPNCTTLKGSAFVYCDSLTEINIPNCETVEYDTFCDCHKLQSINLSKVSYLSNGTLARCYSLSTVNVPNVLKCGDATFTGDNALQSIDLPLCSMFGNYTFSNCSILTSVNVPNLHSIGDYVFTYCPQLSQLNLSNITYFGHNCFMDCLSLEELTLNLNNYLLLSYNDTLYNTKIANGTGSIYVQSWLYDSYISADGWSSLSARFVSVQVSSTLSFSDGVVSGYTTVLDYSFNSYLGIPYSSVISVSLPNCEYLLSRQGWSPAQYALKECRNLKTIYLGNMRICPTYFVKENNSNLEEVDLPNCLIVESSAFSNCINLVSVNIPLCERVDGDAFNGCSSLNNLSLSLCKYVGSSAFRTCTSLDSIYLPECSYIDTEAFNGCNFSNLTLPKCEYIGFFALANNRSLTSINLPVCSYLSDRCFQWNTLFKEITLGWSGVCKIGNNVFGNTGLTSIYVPSSLVDAYKSASGWASYSNKIFPIPE